MPSVVHGWGGGLFWWIMDYESSWSQQARKEIGLPLFLPLPLPPTLNPPPPEIVTWCFYFTLTDSDDQYLTRFCFWPHFHSFCLWVGEISLAPRLQSLMYVILFLVGLFVCLLHLPFCLVFHGLIQLFSIPRSPHEFQCFIFINSFLRPSLLSWTHRVVCTHHEQGIWQPWHSLPPLVDSSPFWVFLSSVECDFRMLFQIFIPCVHLFVYLGRSLGEPLPQCMCGDPRKYTWVTSLLPL